MLMAGFVFLAAGLIARIRLGNVDPRLFLSLGVVLGLGYLSKSFMFSIAPVFLALAWLIQKRTRASSFRILLAAGVFMLLSLPFILLISNAKGKFTIGEAGTVTFLREVMLIPYPHWQGDPQRNIFPAHPARVIHTSPYVYEFGEPIGGTYPIITDPSYWYEGIPVRVSVTDVLIRLLASGNYFLDLFFEKLGILVACVIALYLMSRRTKRNLFEIVNQWVLVIPAVIAFGLYGMVLVEGRYIGVFVLLFWADILGNIRFADLTHNKLWMSALSGIAALGLLVNIALFNLDGFTRLNPPVKAGLVESSASPAGPLATAQSLTELGVEPGDKVGVIGYAHDSFWARLVKVKISAQMLDPDAEILWRGDDAMQKSVLRALADADVRAVVAEYVPDGVDMTGWHQVGNSNYYIFVFAEQ
jgi:4-amino-4-deoxy-L-arabinose transferase-like glycosyltransferase